MENKELRPMKIVNDKLVPDIVKMLTMALTASQEAYEDATIEIIPNEEKIDVIVLVDHIYLSTDDIEYMNEVVLTSLEEFTKETILVDSLNPDILRYYKTEGKDYMSFTEPRKVIVDNAFVGNCSEVAAIIGFSVGIEEP